MLFHLRVITITDCLTKEYIIETKQPLQLLINHMLLHLFVEENFLHVKILNIIKIRVNY